MDASVERWGGRSQGTTGPRLLVGPWGQVRDDPAVDELRGGPAATGVFASFKGAGPYHLIALDSSATPVRDLGQDAGLVAALRSGDDPATWLVTGSTGPAVRRAASSLDAASLRRRYAVAAPPQGPPLALPLDCGGGG